MDKIMEGIIIGVTSGIVVSVILGLAHWIRFEWRRYGQKKFLCRTITDCKEKMEDKHPETE